MTKRARESVDAATAAGEEPRAPKRGSGIVLKIPGGRATWLMATSGHLTAGGGCFYEMAMLEPPRAGIDPTAAPTRQGNRMLIKLEQ